MDDKAGLACHGSPGKRGRDTDNEVEVGGPDAKNARTGDTNAEARNRTEAAASCYTDMDGASSTTHRGNPKIPTVLDGVLGLPRDVFCKSLSFLADAEAPSELFEASVSCKSFRAAALDNILWKEMCDEKWKTKFGYRFRMDRANRDAKQGDDSEFDLFVSSSSPSSSEIRPYPTAMSDEIDCPKAGFWYHRYWNELKMSTVNRITPSDLREWQWSACRWFAVPDDDEPTVLRSALWETTGDGLRFLEDNTVIGGDKVPSYHTQDNGSIVNTTTDTNCPTWMFHVHRLSNWGWVLWSQYYVLRPYLKKEELDELWDDYLDELIHQDNKEGVLVIREGAEGTTSRIVPRSMADKLEW